MSDKNMAHWIIDFRGFGGSFYTCSKCRKTYWDIARYVGCEEKCPNCGTPINDDENEYIE